MAAETLLDDTKRDTPGPGPDEPDRVPIDPTVLARSLPKDHSGRVLAGLWIGVLLCGGLALQSGAPAYVGLSVLALGFAGLAVLWRGVRREESAAADFDEKAVQTRAEFERLADRMWELQE